MATGRRARADSGTRSGTKASPGLRANRQRQNTAPGLALPDIDDFFRSTGASRTLFSQIMEAGQPLWFRHTETSAETARLVTPEIAAAIGRTSFLAAPLMAQGRAIG